MQAPGTTPKQGSRRSLLLEVAADRFCRNGFHGTSIRDLAKAAGMLPGSVYCHFPSKEDLFVAVYEEGVRRIVDRVEDALDGTDDPWARLRAACVAHLETILDQSHFARVVIRVHPRDVANAEPRLTALRDGYEAIFRRLVDALDAPAAVDRKDLRLFLLGAMNWTQQWYRPGDSTPAAIANRYVDMLERCAGR
jgi:AcrR family transcriptional regulator